VSREGREGGTKLFSFAGFAALRDIPSVQIGVIRAMLFPP